MRRLVRRLIYASSGHPRVDTPRPSQAQPEAVKNMARRQGWQSHEFVLPLDICEQMLLFFMKTTAPTLNWADAQIETHQMVTSVALGHFSLKIDHTHDHDILIRIFKLFEPYWTQYTEDETSRLVARQAARGQKITASERNALATLVETNPHIRALQALKLLTPEKLADKMIPLIADPAIHKQYVRVVFMVRFLTRNKRVEFEGQTTNRLLGQTMNRLLARKLQLDGFKLHLAPEWFEPPPKPRERPSAKRLLII